MEEVIDTNVILRFFVGDNQSQQKIASQWFKEAQKGKRKIIVKPLVVAEACFVLESLYKKKKEKIAEAFEVFLSQKWIKVEEREVMLSLWTWYLKNLHFVDSYLLSLTKIHKSKILTFDQKLLKKSQIN